MNECVSRRTRESQQGECVGMRSVLGVDERLECLVRWVCSSVA